MMGAVEKSLAMDQGMAQQFLMERSWFEQSNSMSRSKLQWRTTRQHASAQPCLQLDDGGASWHLGSE